MTQCPKSYRCSALSFANRLLAASVAVVLFPATAHAFALPELATMRSPDTSSCSRASFEPAAPARSVTASDAGKSSAILGGEVSALDRIRQQQQQVSSANLTTAQYAAGASLPGFSYANCFSAKPGAPLEAITTPAVATISRNDAGGDFLGSSRIKIRHTPFNDDWNRVSSRGLAPRGVALRTAIPSPGAADVETLSRVNSWANQTIKYVEDSVNYGTADYWATASETLASGRGDCEDFAILKYHVLAAMGFDRNQMYLTLARDLVRNADHAVLIVQVGGTSYMLDNATNALLRADVSHDYRPVMSFNTQSAWLHGSGRPTPAAAQSASSLRLSYLSDSAVSNARVTGFNR